MKIRCLFGHDWNGCQCNRCGISRNEQHDWKYVETVVDCSVFSSRGSGQYLDPCYGSPCPCESQDEYKLFICSKCGEKKSEKY